MALVNAPEGGDVVIRTGGADANPPYALQSVAGSDQLARATRVEAERLARDYAQHARVNVWLAGPPSEFTLLVGFRGSETTHAPRFRRGALHHPPAQSARPARTRP